MFRIACSAILAVFLVNPETASAQDMPIEMKASNKSAPPILNRKYGVIGYWDVDDWVGNNGSGIGVIYSGMGTHQIKLRGTGGTYMATLGVNMSELHRITDLRIDASNKSVEVIRRRLLLNNPNADVIYTNGAKTEYIVGVWDVDGGGGHGKNGSFGTYAMTLVARIGTRSTDRKLVDLFLIASDKKYPTLKSGYEVVGYWDVDSGGSRGTDGSRGRYMMTLLAKWN